jgi:transcriptional regulator with XRE-family HTH domain
MTPRRPTYNPPPAPQVSLGQSRDKVRTEFAAKLRRLINDKGWSPSEFSRRVKDNMPGDSDFRPDTVSTYLNAKSMPTDLRLEAMARTLGVKKEDLLPHKGLLVHRDNASPFQIKQLEDGQTWVYVNRAMPLEDALEIMAVLKRVQQKEANQ